MTHLLDSFIGVPYKVMVKIFNDGGNVYQNILNYGIYEGCITLSDHIDLYEAAMMLEFYYYKGTLTNDLATFVGDLLIRGKVTEHRELKAYKFYNQNPCLDMSDLRNCIDASKIIKEKVLEFCSIELGKTNLTNGLVFNTIEVINTFRKYYLGADKDAPVLLSTKKILNAIIMNKCQTDFMDEKDFIRDLLSETKEQDRKDKRHKYPEGTPEREELERKFEWEDRFIPDSND